MTLDIAELEENVNERLQIVRSIARTYASRIDDSKIFYTYLQRRKIDGEAVQSGGEEAETYEVKLREIDWKNIGKKIWGSLYLGAEHDPDRARLLHLARIIAQIACLKYRYNILKSARIVVSGRSGIGKTTYVLYAIYGAMRIGEIEPSTAWRYTNAVWFMNALEFALFMRYIVEENMYIPAVLLDEAGLAFSKYWIFHGKVLKQAFSSVLEMFDLLKDWVGCIILTSTATENIAKRLRDIYDYNIIGDEYSMPQDKAWFTVWVLKRKKLRFYETVSVPDRTVLRRAKLEEMPIYIDVIPSTIKIPREYWEKHTGNRKEMVKDRIDRFIRMMMMLKKEIEEETTIEEE